MDEITKTIETFYDQTVQDEWMRIYNRPEYFITLSFMEQYINPGDSLLDIGGGPGRYSLHFAQKGCKSTLADLSKENVAFAKEKAKEIGVSLQALQADARSIDEHFPPAYFDHVFLMGPLYHLLALYTTC